MEIQITTWEEYKRAITKRAWLKKQNLNTEGLMQLGLYNDAIAEYEENQKQLPDLSFITEQDFEYWQDYSNWVVSLQHEQEKIIERLEYSIPALLRIALRAESDPEAAQLLKDIANVNK